jgi:hypothetical protein
MGGRHELERHERRRHSGGGRFLKVLGSIALVAVAVGVLTQMNDIRRYIRISTM